MLGGWEPGLLSWPDPDRVRLPAGCCGGRKASLRLNPFPVVATWQPTLSGVGCYASAAASYMTQPEIVSPDANAPVNVPVPRNEMSVEF